MGEIFQINFGQIGNDIGHHYLRKLICDHGLDNIGLGSRIKMQNIKASFEKFSNDQHQFRGFFIDIDQKNIDQILISPINSQVNPDFILSKNYSNCSGTYHSGSNIFKNEYQSDFEDKIKKGLEQCDYLNHFNFVSGISDKCCGLTAEAIKILYDNYSNKLHCNTCIFPFSKCMSPIDTYNTIFGISNQIFISDFTLTYDYDALKRANIQLLQDSNQSNYHDIVAETILQANCSSRFPGFQNGDLKQISTNLVLFPRLHFLTCAFTQLINQKDLFKQIQQLSCLQNAYYTFSSSYENSYKSQAMIVRSENKYLEINQFKFNNQIDWLGDGLFHVDCKVEHPYFGETAMHIGNQSNFGLTFVAIQQAFIASFKKKAYLHYYKSEGADEMEFAEAESNVADLIGEYQDYCCCMAIEDEVE